MRLMPFSANMDENGITYDAYTLERWSDPQRTDLMMQQTPSAVGAPWDKVTSVGTNMKQIVEGPDANKMGVFTGKSGIRVGMTGSQEPTWKSFGDMYANFEFPSTSGGSMEAILVRGNPLLTHRYTNANPVLKPYCLSSVNGVAASQECPMERSSADGGSGFLSGTCTGSVLNIVLRNTKEIDIKLVQWAANTAAGWPADHGMNTCGSECTLSEDGRRVDINIPGASGEMKFAVNVIGKYILPPDWVNNPESATCSGVHTVNYVIADNDTAVAPQAEQCDEMICHEPACSGSGNQYNFKVTVNLAQPLSGLDQIQFAVAKASAWNSMTPMITCTSTMCTISEDKKTVEYFNTFDENAVRYAINVINRLIRPQHDWNGNPFLHNCDNGGPTVAPPTNSPTAGPTAPPGCITGALTGSCVDGTMTITLTDTVALDISKIQWAANTASAWPGDHPMNTCGGECTLSSDSKRVDIRVSGASGDMKFAVNVIGRYTIPADWENNPEQTTCTSSCLDNYIDDDVSVEVEYAAVAPSVEQCDAQFCHDPSCSESGLNYNFQLVVRLTEAISGLDQIQFAVDTASQWTPGTPMLTCNNPAMSCVLSADGTMVTYTNTFDESNINYAVNVIGRFVRPPTNWNTNPYAHTCGQVGPTNSPTLSPPSTSNPGSVIASGTKFVLELNEPGDKMPDQTRKFVAYFSQFMDAVYQEDGLYFTPSSGGVFSGLLQLGYVGAGPRSDASNVNFLDPYQGVFSYKPDTSFCVSGNKGYISFDWNKHDVNGPTSAGNLLMVAMPHQESLLTGQGSLMDTPYGFKGLVRDDWLLEEDLPEAGMDPDPAAVDRVKANPEALNNILTAIDRDAPNQDLPGICSSSNSYGVGKAISMVARLASISRAFGTDHYPALDEQIRVCLEKWLRIDDTLSDGNKFRWDSVYGGLLLRSGPAGEPINPNANYGFPVFSDHHFHLGYFVYAMAYYAKYYPVWASAHREKMVMVARDISSPSKSDNFFPVVRHKDFYYGISWATGLVGGTRQAESSTEAIAAYHGVAALGVALNDVTMQHTGQLMLATEIRSVREYYHVRAHNQHNFPPILHGYGCIGQLAEGNIYLYTLNWPCDPFEFPMRHACLVGIQVIPITSIAKYYMDQEWAGRIRNVCTWAINPNSAPGADKIDPSILRPVNLGWGAFCHSAMSKYDDAAKAAAVEYVKDLTPQQLVGGTGAASTLLFIYEST